MFSSIQNVTFSSISQVNNTVFCCKKKGWPLFLQTNVSSMYKYPVRYVFTTLQNCFLTAGHYITPRSVPEKKLDPVLLKMAFCEWAK